MQGTEAGLGVSDGESRVGEDDTVIARTAGPVIENPSDGPICKTAFDGRRATLVVVGASCSTAAPTRSGRRTGSPASAASTAAASLAPTGGRTAGPGRP